jgi:hypothetical protein
MNQKKKIEIFTSEKGKKLFMEAISWYERQKKIDSRKEKLKKIWKT